MSEDTEEEEFLGKDMLKSWERKSNRTPIAIMDMMSKHERRNINQQEMKTPGRRGREIKHEEIDKEMVRRDRIKQNKESAEK